MMENGHPMFPYMAMPFCISEFCISLLVYFDAHIPREFEYFP